MDKIHIVFLLFPMASFWIQNQEKLFLSCASESVSWLLMFLSIHAGVMAAWVYMFIYVYELIHDLHLKFCLTVIAREFIYQAPQAHVMCNIYGF